MEFYFDAYATSSPLPSYSSSIRDLPPVPSFNSTTRHARRRSTVPGEPRLSTIHNTNERERERIHFHAVYLKNSESSPVEPDSENWATLKVQSTSARYPVRIMKSQVVQGSLEINLRRKAKSMESISAELHGKVTVVGDTIRFLFLETQLWHSMPGNTSLLGNYSLPFKFQLPENVSIPRYNSREVDLPYSTDLPFEVKYKVVIKMNRGRFKSNIAMEMPLLYLPSSRAKSPSRQRQRAYRETQIPPGPNLDPDGWLSLGRSTQRGYIFGARIITISFNCFLANPLSYAKGTVVPFTIVTTSDDEQALDLLSSRKALSVTLEQRIQMNVDGRVKAGSDLKTHKIVGVGSFCSASANQPGSGWRMIEGEIHIASNETPSFETVLLTCSHTMKVELNATGFTPFNKKHIIPGDGVVDASSGLSSNDNSILLFSHDVTITTFPSSGPRPIFRTEAVYPVAQTADFELGMVSRSVFPFISA